MAESKLLKFFPVPKYLTLPAFGVEISERTVKYVEVVEGTYGLTVGKYGIVKLPPNTVERGVVVMPDKLTAVLADVAKKSGMKAVRLSIPEEQVYTFQIEVDLVAGMDLRDTVFLNLEGHIPVPADSVEFDYEIISQTSNKALVQVAASEKMVLESYISACENAGLMVLSCEYECQALARAITKPNEKTVSYVIDIGHVSTTVAIVQDGIVVSSTTINSGGELAINAIVEKYKLTKEEAESLKKTNGVTLQSADYPELGFVIKNAYTSLFSDIISHYNNWLIYIRERAHLYRAIDNVYIVGTEALVPGFIDLFESTFHKPVALANVWARIEAVSVRVPKIHFDDSLIYGTAIGLGMSEYTQ